MSHCVIKILTGTMGEGGTQPRDWLGASYARTSSG